MTILATSIRDNSGMVHRRGEPIIVLGRTIELGTHRTLIKAEFAETHQRAFLLSDDVEEEST